MSKSEIEVRLGGRPIGVAVNEPGVGPAIRFGAVKDAAFIREYYDVEKITTRVREAFIHPIPPEFIEIGEYAQPHQPAGEVRTTSSTGGEKGVKPQRFSLIPKMPLDMLGEVYDFGTRKYAPHNYRKGYDWSKSYDALQRHLSAWWEREENDPESGLSHLAHAAFHVFALMLFSKDERYAQFDDRYKPEVRNDSN